MERQSSGRVRLENRQLSLSSLTAKSPVGCMLEHFSVPLSIKLSNLLRCHFRYFLLLLQAIGLISDPCSPATFLPSLKTKRCCFFNLYTDLHFSHTRTQEYKNSSCDINTPAYVGSVTSFKKSQSNVPKWLISFTTYSILYMCSNRFFFFLELSFQRHLTCFRDQTPHHLISITIMDFPNGPPESCCLWEPPKKHGRNMLFLLASPSLFVFLVTGLLHRDAISHLVEPLHLWWESIMLWKLQRDSRLYYSPQGEKQQLFCLGAAFIVSWQKHTRHMAI